MAESAEPAWEPVQSSNIQAVRYRHDTGHIEVQFKSGAVYGYARPHHVYQAIKAAPSVGKAVHHHCVRSGHAYKA